MPDVGELTDRFRAMASTCLPRAPSTARLSAAIAEVPWIVAILRAAPDERQLPVLLLAALHDQVLADPSCELAEWFATVTDRPRQDDVGPALVRHCRLHRDELRSVVADRRIQTNEVGRCGLLLSPLGALDDEVGPIALVDVGTSAGLTLRLDRYAYTFRPGGKVGDDAPVRITVATRGPVPVPARLPRIAARLGIDPAPIDVHDPGAVRWLEACVWPDQRDRFGRLDAALTIARAEPIEIRRGTAAEQVEGVVVGATDHGHPVVVTTWALCYEPERTRVVETLDRLGRTTDLSWIFAESPRQAPGLPVPERHVDADRTVVGLVRWRDGRRQVDHVGVAHPHGYWLHWGE